MTNGKITGGLVSFEDGIKAKEEYAPARKARVELRFDVTEGEEHGPILNLAHAQAVAKVQEMLGQKAAAAVKAASQPAATPPALAETAKPAAVKKTTAKTVGKTKADLEKEMLEAAACPSEAPSLPADGDGDDIEADDDNLDDVLGEAPPDPITDKQLSDACVAKADKMKSVAGWEPKKIRSLIEEFTGAPGKHNREIPAAQRPDFLKRLEALK